MLELRGRALDVVHQDDAEAANAPLPADVLLDWYTEIQSQPSWRARADREADYYDGNQLDSDLLKKQREVGIPPAIEPVIGPTIDAVLGAEARTRTDWRVQPDSQRTTDEVAVALNFKLNQAERHSRADRACSEAYKGQVGPGIGWVEVSRNSDPFKYPYRCQVVHRNEIWWDWFSTEPDLSDARYLIRRRWTDISQIELKFPQHKALIKQVGSRWSHFDANAIDTLGGRDGGTMTGLASAYVQDRGWSIEDLEWIDVGNRRACLMEVWYRRWVNVAVLRMMDGRVLELDRKNQAHSVAIATGVARVERAVVAKMRYSIWLGPHRLVDEPTPYKHQKFPYVAFFGKREDRTRVPYGLIKGMMYQQDNINATTGKIRWGLSAIRATRTKGAYQGTDAQFRANIARVDADIVLDASHMAQPGAMFKIERDFQLNEQQYKMLTDSRIAIERVSTVTAAFRGDRGTARSGVQESTQVEQSNQTLADINDAFGDSRSQVGDLLLSMILQDMGNKREEILIPGNGVREDQTIVLNDPMVDEASGMSYLNNDIERAKLKVVLNDVPSTPSFRAQQLQAMSEAFKSMPQHLQVVALPHLLTLMDVPDREAIIEDVRRATKSATPEEIQARIDEAVEQALMKAQYDLKSRELSLRYSPERIEAEIREMTAKAVKTGVEAAFSAIQTGTSIAMNPAVAPIADSVMMTAGYRTPKPAGEDPNFPQPAAPMAPPPGAQAPTNTSPQQPPVPASPRSPMGGIETQRTTDNQPAGA